MLNVFFLNIKLFYANKWRILSFFIFTFLIYFLFFITINHVTNQNPINPVQVAIVDLDNSLETVLIIQTITDTEYYHGLIEFVILDEKKAEEKLSNNQIVAVITFPENFGTAMTTGENIPFEVMYSQNRPMAAAFLHIVATAFADMLEASQTGVYTTLNFARAMNITSQEFDTIFWSVNLQFLGIIMNRQSVFNATELTTLQLPLIVEYMIAFYLILLLSIFFVVSDIISLAFTKYVLKNLSITSVYIGTWFTFFILTILISVITNNFVPIENIILISVLVSILGVPITFLFNDNMSRNIFLILFLVISLLFSGGIIPLQFIPDMQIFIYANFNYWLAMLATNNVSILALSIFALIYVVIGYFSLHRRAVK